MFPLPVYLTCFCPVLLIVGRRGRLPCSPVRSRPWFARFPSLFVLASSCVNSATLEAKQNSEQEKYNRISVSVSPSPRRYDLRRLHWIRWKRNFLFFPKSPAGMWLLRQMLRRWVRNRESPRTPSLKGFQAPKHFSAVYNLSGWN